MCSGTGEQGKGAGTKGEFRQDDQDGHQQHDHHQHGRQDDQLGHQPLLLFHHLHLHQHRVSTVAVSNGKSLLR